jgi:hypothetical protein
MNPRAIAGESHRMRRQCFSAPESAAGSVNEHPEEGAQLFSFFGDQCSGKSCAESLLAAGRGAEATSMFLIPRPSLSC